MEAEASLRMPDLHSENLSQKQKEKKKKEARHGGSLL
jgi:hypothetical protein